MKFGYGERIKYGLISGVLVGAAATVVLMVYGLVEAFKYHNYLWLPWVAFGLWGLPRVATGLPKLFRIDPDEVRSVIESRRNRDT